MRYRFRDLGVSITSEFGEVVLQGPDEITEKSLQSCYGSNICEDFVSLVKTWLSKLKTSASLKFRVLNPKGRIWTMVAGGGASVICADTVGDLGYASELGNYAEYSGAPSEEEVLQYARVVIDCATAEPDGRKRALVVGGGIANFTDVAAQFSGIIRALKENQLSG